jgi:hypothetical protein
MTDNIFIYGLFKDAVSCSKSVPPSGRMTADKRIREGKIKWPGRDSDHSTSSTAEVKNGGDIEPITNTSSWRSA